MEDQNSIRKLTQKERLDNTEFFKFACQTKHICSQYSDARQSCAEAGNIDQCIKIKMHDGPYDFCTDDNDIKFIEGSLRPNFAQCAASSISSFFE